MTTTDPHVLDVLMGFDRRFLIGGAVAIRSICENASAGTPLRFTILTGDLTEADVTRLRRSLPQRAQRVQLSHRRIDITTFDELLRSKHVSRTAYARLLAGEALPHSVTRVIYVDADVLFLRDITELADLALEGRVLAAVPNESPEAQQKNLARIGVVADSYFASGFMVIDLARWRAERIGERAVAFARQVGERLTLHDQDALNGVIAGNYLPLPNHWGFWSMHGQAPTRSVIHYAMAPKPWHAEYQGAYRDEFYACLDRTDFAGWRPVNLLGLGPLLSRMRRQIPYFPTVIRMTRSWLTRAIASRARSRVL